MTGIRTKGQMLTTGGEIKDNKSNVDGSGGKGSGGNRVEGSNVNDW